MKTKSSLDTFRTVTVTLVVTFICLTWFGCSSDPNNHSGLNKVRDFFYHPTAVTGAPVTNIVPQYAQSDVLAPAQTNFQTGVITPAQVKPGAVPTALQPVILAPVNYHWDNAPTIGDAQAAAGTIPGWGTIGVLGVGLLASVGKIWLNRKEVGNYSNVASSTFQAIEDFANGAAASGDPKATALAAKLKKMLATAHDYAGVSALAADILNQSTGFSSSVAEVAAIAKPTTTAQPAPAT